MKLSDSEVKDIIQKLNRIQEELVNSVDPDNYRIIQGDLLPTPGMYLIRLDKGSLASTFCLAWTGTALHHGYSLCSRYITTNCNPVEANSVSLDRPVFWGPKVCDLDLFGIFPENDQYLLIPYQTCLF